MVKLNTAVESGEKLYASTAADGREEIRQQIRQLKTDWDSLYDEVGSKQRHLEVLLISSNLQVPHQNSNNSVFTFSCIIIHEKIILYSK